MASCCSVACNRDPRTIRTGCIRRDFLTERSNRELPLTARVQGQSGSRQDLLQRSHLAAAGGRLERQRPRRLETVAGGARIVLLPTRRLNQSAGGRFNGVAAGLSFVLWVMPAARASRDHSKKSTLRERNRLREKCLQVKFYGRRGQGIWPRDSHGPHCGAAYLFSFSDEPRT